MKPVFNLDPYEQDLEDHFDEMVEVPRTDPIYQKLQEAASNYLKSKSVNLRVQPSILETIKQKAKKAGLPYQTLINTLLHQYATGKINIEL